MERSLLSITLFCCLLILLSSCQENTMAVINGTVTDGASSITIGTEEVPVKPDGTFRYQIELDYATILTINLEEVNYEVYLKPGATVSVTFDQGPAQFQGDLLTENSHLLADRDRNNQIGEYLNANWYALHSAAEQIFIAKMDSLKQVYKHSMDGAGLNEEFVSINSASVDYAFDRMLLRYPRTHFYFTGEAIALNAKVMERLDQVHDRPQFLYIDSYQKFVQTWIDAKLAETALPKDSPTYHGEVMLKAGLRFIESNFSSQVLNDFWKLVYLQKHVENYAWINGEQHLEVFMQSCRTGWVLEQAQAFREAELVKLG